MEWKLYKHWQVAVWLMCLCLILRIDACLHLLTLDGLHNILVYSVLPKEAVLVCVRDPWARLVASVSSVKKASTRSKNNFFGSVPHWLWMECNLTDEIYTPDPGNSSCLPGPLTWNCSALLDCFSTCWKNVQRLV